MKVRHSYESIMNKNISCINLFVLPAAYVFILRFPWSGTDITFEENRYFEDVKKTVCVDLSKAIPEAPVALIGILFSSPVSRLTWRILSCVLSVTSTKLLSKTPEIQCIYERLNRENQYLTYTFIQACSKNVIFVLLV